MQITYKQIINFLKNEKIGFSIKGTFFESYQICSIFQPETNGFYFFEGKELNLELRNSLILCSENLKIEHTNGLILIDQRSQMVFYEILNSLFEEKSSGVISEFAIIDDKAIIGENVQIDPFVIIGQCEIGENTIIRSHTKIHDNSTIGTNVTIESNCTIGATGTAWTWKNVREKVRQPQLGGVIIENNCFIGANSVIVRGSLNENSLIGKNSLIAPGARIGHGTQIGKNVHFANNVVTGGNTKIDDFCFIGSSVTFRPKVKIHQFTVVGAGAVVVKDSTKSKQLLIGVPAEEKEIEGNLKGMPNYSA